MWDFPLLKENFDIIRQYKKFLHMFKKNYENDIDKEFDSKIWIQPNDQEGKVDVFARLKLNKTFPKLKKISFENYHSQNMKITSDQQLNEILKSLNIDLKVDKKQIVDNKVTNEDVFIIKG